MQPDRIAEDRRLLAYLGAAMIAGGQPVHEVEDELTSVATAMGHPLAQIGATPTGLTLGLEPGAAATFESVDGPLRLDQSAVVADVRRGLVARTLSVDEAFARLGTLRSLPHRYPQWVQDASWPVIAVGIAMLLQPGWPNIAAAAIGGIVVMLLVKLAGRVRFAATLLPTIAAFTVGTGVFAAAQAGWLDGPLRTLLAPLAVLLPGALMVTGMSELAAGAMVAGSSRLTFGTVQLLLFSLGILSATSVLGVAPDLLVNERVNQLGWWGPPVGLALICVGVCLNEGASMRLLPAIGLVVAAAFGAQLAGQHISGAVLGGFLGAIAGSLGASLVASVRPRLPRLVVFLPAFWVLVPGSLGLLSVTSVGIDPEQGVRTVVDVAAVICALALGLLFGSALAQAMTGRFERRKHT
ncbi:threonine/serine exporter family protein [Tsukamurella asaccharolytica]|uniref:Threonine/serine exporter family protein n=1 Tax=Tsukamurella asaccharolytica TaxID=2592067 RepID=A0A5C5RDJ5_9ACTN|nr:threonine/serine exporter family protein [Tsukamurella asaccharolytica]TWS20738.1 threonine/serine exporter family protein [Tsukamurella asaccharolytica]